MQKHERFEELGSLAIIGQLSVDEHAELQAHLQACPACRRAAREFVDAIHHLPLEESTLTDDQILELQDSSRAEHFLARAQAAGVHFSKDALNAERPNASIWRWFVVPKLAVGPALAAVLVAAVAMGILRSGSPRQTVIVQQAPLAAAPKASAPIHSSDDDALRVELAKAKERLTSLELQANELKARVSSSENGRERAVAEFQRQRLVVAQLQEQVSQQDRLLSQRASESQEAKTDRDKLVALLVADESRLRDLEGEVRNAQSVIEQERQLNGAAHDVRELMGARHLHIVDVYDSDNHSAASRSFGRVIYTEGKSLIFYAFDLDKAHNVRKVSFQGWGEREGEHKEPTKLGVFYVDDLTQKRWVMKVSDAERLRTIDTVFITVETHGDASSPSGQRLLQAYLGSKANHP